MTFEECAAVFFASEDSFALFCFVLSFVLMPFALIFVGVIISDIVKALVKRFVYPGKQPSDKEVK